MRFILIFPSLFLCFLTSIQAQELIVTAHPSKVALGEITRLKYHFTGESNQSIELPDFVDFVIVSGPSRRQSVSIINGRRSSSLEVSVDLMPRKSGAIKIPEASIKTKNGSIKSNLLIVHVEEKRESLKVPERLKTDGYAIIAETNKDTVFQGEQLVLIYKILYTTPIEKHSILYESDYNGSLTMSYKVDQPIQTDTIDGLIYHKATLLQRAIFPYQEGVHHIDPLIVNLYVPDKSKPRRSFSFFDDHLKSIRVYSDRTEFIVLPQNVSKLDSLLPIEPLTMNISLPDSIFTSDDLVPLKAVLHGSSDPALMRAPILRTDFPIYYNTPRAKQLNKSAGNDGISYLNTFDYYIQVQDTGIFEFQFITPYLKKNGSTDTLYSEKLSIPIYQGKHFGSLTVLENKTKDNSFIWLISLLAIVIIFIALYFNTHLRKLIGKQRNKPNPRPTQVHTAKTTINDLMKNLIQMDIRDLLKIMKMSAAAIAGRDISRSYDNRHLKEGMVDIVKTENIEKWDNLIRELEKCQYGIPPEKSEITFLQTEVKEWVEDIFPFIQDNS